MPHRDSRQDARQLFREIVNRPIRFAHRLCRLVWKIVHHGIMYEERGPVVSKTRAQRRAAKMVRELRALGYRVELSKGEGVEQGPRTGVMLTARRL